MYVICFWFDSKLVLEKTKKPASYELGIHTVFFQIFYINFLKESFWYFQINILADFKSPSSL